MRERDHGGYGSTSERHGSRLVFLAMKSQHLLPLLIVLAFAAFIPTRAAAEDWGAYTIVPAGAPSFVLEAVDAGTGEGTLVSINKADGKPHQKWNVVAKEAGFYAIKPAHAPSLALAAAQGGTKMGTVIVLEKDEGKPSQLWKLTRQANGSYTLTPKSAPELGLDHNGGKPQAGAKIDLWTYKATDQHLQWFIRPLAGSGVAAANPDAGPGYQPPAIKPEDLLPGQTKLGSVLPRARSSPAPYAM